MSNQEIRDNIIQTLERANVVTVYEFMAKTSDRKGLKQAIDSLVADGLITNIGGGMYTHAERVISSSFNKTFKRPRCYQLKKNRK
jgi:hypothetical protein